MLFKKKFGERKKMSVSGVSGGLAKIKWVKVAEKFDWLDSVLFLELKLVLRLGCFILADLAEKSYLIVPVT